MARIIVAGYMVRNPIGGSLWADLQYVLGLRRLKHDAYFFEEFGWPNSCYDYANDRISDGATWGAHVIRRLMRRFDLNHRWVYRDADGKYHGLSANRMHEIISSADLLLNLSGATWFDEFERIPYRMFVVSLSLGVPTTQRSYSGLPGGTHTSLSSQCESGRLVVQCQRLGFDGIPPVSRWS